MYASRIALLGLLGVLIGSTAGAETGTANAGRMALLAAEAAALTREAERITGAAPQAPPGAEEAGSLVKEPATVPFAPGAARDRFGSIPVQLPRRPIGGLALGLLAIVATLVYLVIQSRLRRKVEAGAGEMREVTWRFRSPQPIRVNGKSAHRVAEVLDEIEQLGKQLRAITTGEASSEPAAALPAASVATSEPVVFTRREPSRQAGQTVPAPAPANAPVRIESAETPRLQRREVAYSQARRLLRSGQDRLAVREATGLKLAEIDLLRCVRADERAA
jgi:hypothetical protein